jgi:hypothetical protein
MTARTYRALAKRLVRDYGSDEMGDILRLPGGCSIDIEIGRRRVKEATAQIEGPCDLSIGDGSGDTREEAVAEALLDSRESIEDAIERMEANLRAVRVLQILLEARVPRDVWDAAVAATATDDDAGRRTAVNILMRWDKQRRKRSRA